VAGAGCAFLFREAGFAMLCASLPFLVGGLDLFVVHDASYVLLSPSQGIDRLYHRPPYLIGAQIADYLHAHAAPDDMLYVAFYEADLYYLTELRSSSHYLFRLDLDRLPGAFDSVVDDVASRKPTYVLDLRQALDPRLDRERFYRALRAGYVPEAVVGSAVLYHRIPPR
jgi:hypothetical protein